jgi:hypothetical protein
LFPYEVEQSTSCYSEREMREPLATKFIPSRAPVEEKAQQEPHEPWFLTPVTAPRDLQSTEAGESY